MKNKKIKSESTEAFEKLVIEAILNGYDNGLIFEYCNVYNKKSPLWTYYMIGYITGYQNVFPVDEV